MAKTSRHPSTSGKENGITKSSETPNPSPTRSRNRSDASHSDHVPVASQRKSESESSREDDTLMRNPSPTPVTQVPSWSIVKSNRFFISKVTTPSERSLLSTSRESSLCTHSTSDQSWPTEVSPSETSRQSWPTERIGLSAISRPSWRSAKVTNSGTTIKTWTSTKAYPSDTSKVSLAVGRFSSSAITRSWLVKRSRSGTRRSRVSARFSCSVVAKPRLSTKRCNSAASRQSWPSSKPCQQTERRQSKSKSKPSADNTTPVEVTHVEHLLRAPKISTSEITRQPSWSSVKGSKKHATKQLWPAPKVIGHPWMTGSFSPQTVMGRFWNGDANMSNPYWVSAKICPSAPRKCSRYITKTSPECVTNYWPFSPVSMSGQSWPFAKYSPGSGTRNSWSSAKSTNNQPQSLVPRQYWPTVMTKYNPPPSTKNLWQPQKICPHAVMGQAWNPPRLMPAMSRQPWYPSGKNPPAFAGVLWAPARFNPSGMSSHSYPYPSGKAMSQSQMKPCWSSGRYNSQAVMNVPWLASKMSGPTVTRYFGPAFMNSSPHVPWQSSSNIQRGGRNMWPFPKMIPQMMTHHPMFPTTNYAPAINNR